jgi:hypothetical protein
MDSKSRQSVESKFEDKIFTVCILADISFNVKPKTKTVICAKIE